MRIIGGQFGGRKFHPPAKTPARPTTDMAKEGLFNMLQNMMDFEGLEVLDLFAGTGNISFEFASRGASHLTLVEQDKSAVAFIKKTFEVLNFTNYQLILGNALTYLSRPTRTFDVVFADPPYALPQMAELPNMILASQLLAEEGILILEHSRNVQFEKHPHFLRSKKYGDSYFSLFQK